MKSIIVAALLASAASAASWEYSGFWSFCDTAACGTCFRDRVLNPLTTTCSSSTPIGSCAANGTLTMTKCDGSGTITDDQITAAYTFQNSQTWQCSQWEEKFGTSYADATNGFSSASKNYVMNPCGLQFGNCDGKDECDDSCPLVDVSESTCATTQTKYACNADGSLTIAKFPTTACTAGSETSITVPHNPYGGCSVVARGDNLEFPSRVYNYCPMTFETCNRKCRVNGANCFTETVNYCSIDKQIGRCDESGNLHVTSYLDRKCLSRDTTVPVVVVPYNPENVCENVEANVVPRGPATYSKPTVELGYVNNCKPTTKGAWSTLSAAPAGKTVVATAVAAVVGVLALV